MKTCQNCGKIMEDNTIFCANCGAQSLSAATPAPANAKEPMKPGEIIAGIIGISIILFIVFIILRIGIFQIIIDIIAIAIVWGIVTAIIEAFSINEKAARIIAGVLVTISSIPLIISQVKGEPTVNTINTSNTASIEKGDQNQAVVSVIKQYFDAITNSDAQKVYKLVYTDDILKCFTNEDYYELKTGLNDFHRKAKENAKEQGISSLSKEFSIQIINTNKISNEELSSIRDEYLVFYELIKGITGSNNTVSITDGYAVTVELSYSGIPLGTRVFDVVKINNEYKISNDTFSTLFGREATNRVA